MFGDLATPPPWVRVERFCDIDSQAAQYRGYGQEYQQLSPGSFDGRVTAFDFGDDFALQFETANQELAQAAVTPADHWGVCLLTENSPPCTLNGATLARDHVVVCPGGKALVGKTPAGVNVYCMDLSRELVLGEAHKRGGVEVIYDARGARSLREALISGLSTLVRLQSIEQHSAAAKAFKSSVADILWRIVSGTTADSVERTPQCARRRAVRLFCIAQEYIDHRLTDGISIAEVCKHAGASRRSLECIFQSILGMGPGAYVRNLQLNRVRRDLLSGDREALSIGEIAARYGVWHWSRFSQNYKLLFGELPSQTRARRASALSGGGNARSRQASQAPLHELGDFQAALGQ
ncbi:MAG TPA: helix-turn-helix domain-containing protein [Steroidobacteraceae bacterium]|nr:helix-turn-helix domain-containing protein [Steroidobacteraceae bacterium]